MNQSNRETATAPAVIPKATDYAIKRTIVDLIELYIRGKLSLAMIASFAETIQHFIGQKNRNTWELLEQLRLLADHPHIEEEQVWDVLLAILKQVKKELRHT